ncbi:hypothetical protein QEH34_gp32 [Microbacterium phage Footloose]|uniref:Uncharacterized protein n=1 Tax=Microbacterium phage Footloose TaxID=2836048 RepID=A0A8F3EBK4_9CAUD|nr:hypothetical protein QEH34_gp32 [Microbacterium phage Footloose]QWY84614.1 hypothetical protein SEA_FOOTLOOSE_32 [Microbacterium phage Footloose]
MPNPLLSEVRSSDWSASDWLTWMGNDASYLHWPHGAERDHAHRVLVRLAWLEVGK